MERKSFVASKEKTDTPIYSDKVKDDEIYRKLLGGETDAYDQLLLRYGDSLTIYLHGITHKWQDAEDMMIEAFARFMATSSGGVIKSVIRIPEKSITY